MKKITLLAFAIITSFFTTQAQIVVDQPSDPTGTALVDFQGNDGIGVFVADDFELTDETVIAEIDIFGRLSNLINFTDLSSLNVFIYEDNAGLPSSNPSVLGTGLVEITDIPISLFSLVEDGAGLADFINIQVTDANGGTEVVLPAGTYWLCVFPTVDEAFSTTGLNRWNWLISSAPNTGTEPVLIDPNDQFGGGFVDWTNISGLIAESFPSLAFQIRDDTNLSTGENTLSESISLFPNPTNGDVNLNFSRSFGTTNVDIINVNGQKVLNASLEGVGNNTLATSKLASGIYFAQISNETGSTTIKFIKS